MSVQEIEVKTTENTSGIAKRIDHSAQGMIMDIVQSGQYTKPIPSTVRELVSNAVDAQTEKEKAIEILTGQCTPDKYFVERAGLQYLDSKWDPSYFDLNKLNRNQNHVELTYKQNNGEGRCDRFIIQDHGAGMGGTRLSGYFLFGFSSKRSRTDAFGAFGIGAKAAFSTGTDWYKVITIHNGLRFEFQVWTKKADSLIGPLNLDTGKPNYKHTFKQRNEEGVLEDVLDKNGNPVIAYGIETDELNGTRIEIPVFKHYKNDFDLAVKTQLLHFNNIKYFHESVDGHRFEILFQSKTLYNSKTILIAEDTPYSKPYVLVVKGGGEDTSVGVAYGHIAFEEMELEDMRGDIGIKCPIRQAYVNEDGDEIEINPGIDVVASREAVRWTQNTKNFLKRRFEEAQEEATGLVELELKETDFFKWLQACKSISTRSSTNSALGKLAKIVDLSQLKPVFKEKIEFYNPSETLGGFTIFEYKNVYDSTIKKSEVKGVVAAMWNEIDFNKLYLREDEKTDKIKDAFLAKQHEGHFNIINPQPDDIINTKATEYAKAASYVGYGKNRKKVADRTEIFNNRIHVIELIKEEVYKSITKRYSEVEVPASFIEEYNRTQNGKDEAEVKPMQISPDERRALDERTIIHKFITDYSNTDRIYKKVKIEPKIKELTEYEGQVYYGYQDDDSKLQFALCLVARQFRNKKDPKVFFNDDFKFISVSKNNKKYIKQHIHINDFFGKSELVYGENMRLKGIKIMIDNLLVKWHTAHEMHKKFTTLAFLENFSIFNKEMADLFQELKQYMNDNYCDLNSYKNKLGIREHQDDFLKYMGSLKDLQLYISENKDSPELIADKVKDLNISTGTIGVCAIDEEVLSKFNTLLAYCNPLSPLLNLIPDLTGLNNPTRMDYSRDSVNIELKEDSVMLIKEFINFKSN